MRRLSQVSAANAHAMFASLHPAWIQTRCFHRIINRFGVWRPRFTAALLIRSASSKYRRWHHICCTFTDLARIQLDEARAENKNISDQLVRLGPPRYSCL
jgi:hypothetical protein